MSFNRRVTIRLFLLLWAGYLTLAQPGLPACWLEARPCEYHIHLGRQQVGSAHSHNYLFDLANASAAQALAISPVPVNLLIEMLFLISLFRGSTSAVLRELNWIAPPFPPPPRAGFSF